MSSGTERAATVNRGDEGASTTGSNAESRSDAKLRPNEERLAREAELVRAVQQGDRAAYGALVERYLDPAYAVALSIMRHEQDTEDAVQAAFIRALEKVDQLRPGSPFGPWFYRVLRSTCLNLRRREALRSHGEIPAGASGDSDPARELERTRARERVLAALERLPEQQRLAVMLYDLEGYEHREIAEILEIAPGTSRANLHHGRKALRKILGPEEGETDEA